MALTRSTYHHGDLRAALIKAADAIIAEGGLEAFSLREAAQRAGVSPGAPAYHFGSAKGLLTEVAILALNGSIGISRRQDAATMSLPTCAQSVWRSLPLRSITPATFGSCFGAI